MARIEDIIEAERKRLEGVLRAAYEAGRDDARQEILRVVAGGCQITDLQHKTEESDDAPRKRAPRGLPKQLTDRVVSENAIYGSSPQDIIDAAITEHEKMISISSIRSELRKGKSDGRYIEKDGRWYPNTAPAGAALKAEPHMDTAVTERPHAESESVHHGLRFRNTEE